MHERFFAWLDGELDAAEAAEMERRVAADPELSRLAQEHRALARRLTTAFEPIAHAPVPERLASSVRPSATVTDLASRRERRRFGSIGQWAAMAASLAIGLFVGNMAGPADSPVTSRSGALYASADLDSALDTQLASAPSGEVRIGLTFRDASGDLCRSFSAPAASGLACRKGEDWQVRGLFTPSERQSGEFRMASGDDPRLAALVEETIAGEPFDADQEAEAKARNWR